jgi:hypothetical protein
LTGFCARCGETSTNSVRSLSTVASTGDALLEENIFHAELSLTERRRSRTYPPMGYDDDVTRFVAPGTGKSALLAAAVGYPAT